MPQAKLNADGERLCFPETQAGRQAVREQVGHILASLLLRNSKRLPGFPNYAVESALAVNAQPPTERTVGLEVFGREPDYDTAQDPVVRMTAVEIRKRLTVYYQAPEHANEIRIELPSGSYVTEFRRPMHFPVAIVDRQPRRSTPSTRRFPWWPDLSVDIAQELADDEIHHQAPFQGVLGFRKAICQTSLLFLVPNSPHVLANKPRSGQQLKLLLGKGIPDAIIVPKQHPIAAVCVGVKQKSGAAVHVIWPKSEGKDRLRELLHANRYSVRILLCDPLVLVPKLLSPSIQLLEAMSKFRLHRIVASEIRNLDGILGIVEARDAIKEGLLPGARVQRELRNPDHD